PHPLHAKRGETEQIKSQASSLPLKSGPEEAIRSSIPTDRNLRTREGNPVNPTRKLRKLLQIGLSGNLDFFVGKKNGGKEYPTPSP
ncbi:MAG TPA: hypothetical protein VFW53_12040, partial [Gallionella sp.]|nr:hypothetical protein [Gallionella sp.]